MHGYDVIVLDRDLPLVHGDEVAAAVWRGGAATRVLMLTAAASVRDRVSGLALGADDYLTKPFAFAELAARVHALARRTRPAAPPVLERTGVLLDPGRREAAVPINLNIPPLPGPFSYSKRLTGSHRRAGGRSGAASGS